MSGSASGGAGQGGAGGQAGSGAAGSGAAGSGAAGPGGAAGEAGGGSGGAAGGASTGGAGGEAGGGAGGGAGEGGAGGSGPGKIQKLTVVVRTGGGQFDGTDDAGQLCLAEGRCFGLDNKELNDRERGSADHYDLDPGDLSKAGIEYVSLTTDPGTNAWRPACVAVVADGELIYCNDELSVTVGSQGNETKVWKDTLKKNCESCYRQGSPLTHGPMVGHTTSGEARVWVRTGSSREVRVRYGTSAELVGAQLSGPVVPGHDSDFTGEVALSGLSPSTQYSYRVEIDGEPVGDAPYPTFRTAPSSAVDFTVAFGSCSRFENAAGSAWEGFPVFDSIRKASPDVLLMIGDNHYANSTDTARLRWFYRQSRDEATLAGLLRGVPTWAVWDDHDFAGNNTEGDAPGKENALVAFDQYWANPSAGSGGAPGIWTKFTWGRVEFFLLDDRYYRTVAGGTMLGDEQRQWLLSELSASKATFKVLVSGSAWFTGGSDDSWDVFLKERDQILDHALNSKIGGVVLLSGDIHRSGAVEVKPAKSGGYPIFEYISSPLGNSNSLCKDVPGQLFCRTNGRFFGLLRFTEQPAPALKFELRGEDGGLLESHSVTAAQLGG